MQQRQEQILDNLWRNILTRYRLNEKGVKNTMKKKALLSKYKIN